MMMLPMKTHSSPKMIRTWAPTPAAPMVWAMVLRVRIAASGRSRLSFIRSRVTPIFLPRSMSRTTCDRGSERMAASSREQRNETPSASAAYTPSMTHAAESASAVPPGVPGPTGIAASIASKNIGAS